MPCTATGSNTTSRPGGKGKNLECRPHALQALALGELPHVRARDHHDVRVTREPAGLSGERLAQQPLDLVALDRAPHLARHRDAEARAVGGLELGRRVRCLARERVQHEVPVPGRPALAVDALELRAARQPPALGAARTGPAGAGGAVLHRQTVSRLRPLARRRFSTMRPARVLIRSRKPWVRARLRFLGW